MRTHAVRDTSLQAFRYIQPKLGPLQARVLREIRERGHLSNSEIAYYTGIPINVVTPRTYELRAKGLVEEAGRVTCIVTGKKVIAWRCS